MLTELFVYRFVSSLTFPVAHELHVLTGMRIGDIGSPNKDTPGSGQVAGNVPLTLERGEEHEEWYLNAFTHDLSGADLTAVALLRERLRLILTELTSDVKEIFSSPVLPYVQPLPERAHLLAQADGMARAERYDHATAGYTCALALMPLDAEVVLKRAVCLRRLGRIDDALVDYTRAIGLAPDQARPYGMRASVYAAQGRHVDALADLETACALDPTNPDHWVKAGLLYYTRDTFAAAVDAFSAALMLRPNQGDLYYFRGCAEARFDQMEQAAEDFAQAERYAATLTLVQLSDVLINRVATLVRIAGRDALEVAVGSVTRLLGAGAADPPPAVLLLLRGDIRQRLGNQTAALSDCDSALALAPADPRIYNVKGTALAAIEQFGEALAAFSQAALLAPNEVDYMHNRAITLSRMGRYEAALAEYKRALLLDPDSARLYSERGEIHAVLGHNALAEADYLQALALAPGDLPTMLRLGVFLGNRSDLSTAKQYLDWVAQHATPDLQGIARARRKQLLLTPMSSDQVAAPLPPVFYGDKAIPRYLAVHGIPAAALEYAA